MSARIYRLSCNYYCGCAVVERRGFKIDGEEFGVKFLWAFVLSKLNCYDHRWRLESFKMKISVSDSLRVFSLLMASQTEPRLWPKFMFDRCCSINEPGAVNSGRISPRSHSDVINEFLTQSTIRPSECVRTDALKAPNGLQSRFHH